MLARVIWLTVGTSAVISSDSPAEKWKPCFPAFLSEIKRVTIVACGTSFYAGMVARYWFEQFARVPVDLDVASEFRYRAPVIEPDGLALFISQSGETADTLRSEEHTSELQSLMRNSYAVFCLKKNIITTLI